MASRKKVTITGGAGRIAYSLIPILLHGHVFGPSTTIDLVLLDIPDAAPKLQGIALELDDSSFPLLGSLTVTTVADDAFENCDVAILLGGFPRLPGMERRDLLIKNAENIRAQAVALNRTASKDVKVVVVANPANTNCLVAIRAAPNIPPANFTCLTRLDEERLRGFCAKKVGVTGEDVDNVFIFGNHSNTQVPYIGHGIVPASRHPSGSEVRVGEQFSAEEFEAVMKRVQNRGAEIIKALQLSSALSAAEATAKHLRDWLGPAIPRSSFSMGILLEGNPYGLSSDLVYSLPCQRAPDTAAGYRVQVDMDIPEATLQLMRVSETELLEERREVQSFL